MRVITDVNYLRTSIKKKLMDNAHEISSLQKARMELLASKLRCEQCIAHWVYQLMETIQTVGKELVVDVEKIHRELEGKVLQAELFLSRDTRDLWQQMENISVDKLGEKFSSDLDVAKLKDMLISESGDTLNSLLDKQRTNGLVNIINFVPNLQLQSMSKSDIGFLDIKFQADNLEQIKFEDTECDTTSASLGKEESELTFRHPPVSNKLLRPKAGNTNTMGDNCVADSSCRVQDVAWPIGSLVLAKWSEDQVWYRARVEECSHLCVVTFTDYGNSDSVELDCVVQSYEDIPVNQLDMIDENVEVPEDEEVSSLTNNEVNSTHVPQPNEIKAPEDISSLIQEESSNELSEADPISQGSTSNLIKYFESANPGETEELMPGMPCLVKSEADGTWYHGKIHKQLGSSKSYIVQYLHKQVFDLVKKDHIVTEVSLIPKGDKINYDRVECGNKVQFSGEAKIGENVVIQNVIDIDSSDEKIHIGEEMKIKWTVGEICLGCWSEDRVWYNAEVIAVVRPDLYQVRFTDYGNEDTLGAEDLVKEKNLLPSGCQLDCEVKSDDMLCKWQVGDLCIARWDEDMVWYRARVDQTLGVGEVFVTFIDYGNTATVTGKYIVASVGDVPKDELVDEEAACNEIQLSDNNYTVKVGDNCISQWAEDEVWYNCKVEEIIDNETVRVVFTDYGNSDLVSIKFIVNNPSIIPSDSLVDENVVQF